MEILAQIIAYLIFAGLILCGLGVIVAIVRFFYYRQWRDNTVKVYYDDNDHRKGYYIVKRPRGPYPVGYPKEQIVKDMEAFERLKRKEKEKRKGKLNVSHMPNIPQKTPNISFNITPKPKKPRPMWFQILLMTPAEYMAYRRQRKEVKKDWNRSRRSRR